MIRRVFLYIDLDSRFEDNNAISGTIDNISEINDNEDYHEPTNEEILSKYKIRRKYYLPEDDNGFILIDGYVKDNWFCYKEKKCIDMNEIRNHCIIKNNESYWWCYITNIKNEDNKEINIYYRESPIIIDEVELTNGHFCFDFIS